MPPSRRFAAVVLGLAAWPSALAAPPTSVPRRARPPVWDQATLDAFFPDALRTLDDFAPDAPAAASNSAATATEAPGQPSSAEETPRWSLLIGEESLTAEIKRLTNELAEPLANASRFQGGGFQHCRRNFAALAVLFGVAEQYDGELRLQRDAPLLRWRLARASRNAQVGSDQTYAEGLSRKADLEDALGGQRLEPGDVGPLAWHELAERPLLMQRMETAQRDAIAPALASPTTFRRGASQVHRQAQLLAVLGELIRRPPYDHADDPMFVQLACQLRDAGTTLAQAAEQGDYPAARAAAGRLSQACSSCHEGYRG